MEILELQNNNLKTIPNEIGELKMLSSINLLGNNLGDIPKTLFRISKLRTIYLDKDDLKLITESDSQFIKEKGIRLIFKNTYS